MMSTNHTDGYNFYIFIHFRLQGFCMFYYCSSSRLITWNILNVCFLETASFWRFPASFVAYFGGFSTNKYKVILLSFLHFTGCGVCISYIFLYIYNIFLYTMLVSFPLVTPQWINQPPNPTPKGSTGSSENWPQSRCSTKQETLRLTTDWRTDQLPDQKKKNTIFTWTNGEFYNR